MVVNLYPGHYSCLGLALTLLRMRGMSIGGGSSGRQDAVKVSSNFLQNIPMGLAAVCAIFES